MGLTKQYLRYVPSGTFNVIASADCNTTHVSLNGVSGRYIAVGACEHVIIWDMRLGEKVTYIENMCLRENYLGRFTDIDSVNIVTTSSY